MSDSASAYLVYGAQLVVPADYEKYKPLSDAYISVNERRPLIREYLEDKAVFDSKLKKIYDIFEVCRSGDYDSDFSKYVVYLKDSKYQTYDVLDISLDDISSLDRYEDRYDIKTKEKLHDVIKENGLTIKGEIGWKLIAKYG